MTDLPSAVSAQALGDVIGLTDRRVRQLADQGVIEKAGRGLYQLGPSVRAYMAWRLRTETSKLRSGSTDDTLRAAREREIEQRMAMKDRQLIDIHEHDAVMDEAFGMLKAELIGLGARVSREKPLRIRIESEVDGALNRCAARFAERSEELREAGAVSAPEPEDDAG